MSLDLTFLVPFAPDSDQRVRNVRAVLTWLSRSFDARVVVGGVGLDEIGMRVDVVDLVPWQSGIRDEWHPGAVRNQITACATTSVIALWDADVWCAPAQVLEALRRIEEGQCSMAFPYDGRFVHVDGAWATNLEAGAVEPRSAISVAHPGISVGGAVLFDRLTYVAGGMDNEQLLGWGPDDRERVRRFERQGVRCERVDGPLYHLDHDRPHERYYGSGTFQADWQRVFGQNSEAPIELCPICAGGAAN